MRIAFSFCLASILSAAGSATSRNDEAVTTVVRLFQEDFNDGAFKKAPSYTTEDWEHIHSGGGITRGRDEVLRDVRGVHQTFLKGVSMMIDSMSVRYLTSDVAIVDAVHTVSPHKSSSGQMHVNEQWRKTYVIVRTQGRWLLAHDHSTTIEGSMIAQPTK